MKVILEYLSRRSTSFFIFFGFLFVVLVGIIDHLTGSEIAFSIFYLLPISMVTWFTGRRTGNFISIISAVTWLVTDLTTGHRFSHPFILFWNTLIIFVFFFVITFTLSELRISLEKERKLARLDPLTEVANRRFFIEMANNEINRVRRYNHPFAVAYMDIDNFKTVNDRFGHSTGDILLRSTVNVIHNSIRITDMVARLGGDELAILLPETDAEQALVVVRKIHANLMHEMNRNRWPVSFSIGLVTFVTPPRDVNEIIKIADNLMYSAKNNGKNMIMHEVFDKQE